MPCAGPEVASQREGVMALHQQPAYDAEERNGTDYKVPSDLTSLFFPDWALKQTLEAQLFRALFTEIELEVQPQNVFDVMEVAEIAHCFFQQQQVQRSFRDVVRSARSAALVTIIAPFVGHDFDRAGDLASQYFSGDAEKRQ